MNHDESSDVITKSGSASSVLCQENQFLCSLIIFWNLPWKGVAFRRLLKTFFPQPGRHVRQSTEKKGAGHCETNSTWLVLLGLFVVGHPRIVNLMGLSRVHSPTALLSPGWNASTWPTFDLASLESSLEPWPSDHSGLKWSWLAWLAWPEGFGVVQSCRRKISQDDIQWDWYRFWQILDDIFLIFVVFLNCLTLFDILDNFGESLIASAGNVLHYPRGANHGLARTWWPA